MGRAEIGAAWSKRSNEGRDYLSLKLDDPSFNAPIYANLFDDEDGEGYTLIWSRPRKQRRLSRPVCNAPPGPPGGAFAPDRPDRPALSSRQPDFPASTATRRGHATARSANQSLALSAADPQRIGNFAIHSALRRP